MSKTSILSVFFFFSAFMYAQQVVMPQAVTQQQMVGMQQDLAQAVNILQSAAYEPQTATAATTTAAATTATATTSTAVTETSEVEIDAVKPLSIIYSANVVCQGDTITLTEDHDPLGTVINPMFIWDVNGDISTSQTLRYSPQQEVTKVILSIYSAAVLIASDTTYLYMTQKPKTTVRHDTICYGDEALAGVDGGKYWYWNTNQISQQINIRPFYTTPYIVFSSEYPINVVGYTNECYTVDTAWVIVHRDRSTPISGDTIVCSGMEYTYSVQGASAVNWWDGNNENPRNIVINDDTVLSYTGLSANGCKMQGTLSVKVIASSDGGIEGETSFCIGDTIILSVETSAANIKWFNGDTSAEIRFVANVSFTVYCRISGETNGKECIKKLEHPVEVKECLSMFFPTGFKPDGITTTYGPIGVIDPLKKYEFSIYTNIGERIFETTDLKIKWDGRIGGKDAPAGVYIYKYRETVERFTFEKRGTFTLVK
ncbi:MAG: gliding motility-associated C-terminal domain-containing protein [Bacteroidales bacterium]|jgi:hypothetical protein|nr:gliding motility-associated C-terminal domain-containing protein [Bacteroidales bacterium]